jgi:hypothetical protein
MIGLANDMPKENARRMERAASFGILQIAGWNLSIKRHAIQIGLIFFGFMSAFSFGKPPASGQCDDREIGTCRRPR